jgi:NADH-quinone oxidoreductase subunit B
MALSGQDAFLATRLDVLANWVRSNSLWPMPFATACCGIELMAVGASRHDIARFGAEVMRFSPRQCDLMIVAGRVVMKMMPVLQRIWLQMPEPKWCISMGACASSGGVFDTYAVVQGVDRFMPVDVYIPGCPPRPEQIIQSILDLQEKIRKTGTLLGKEFDQRTGPEAPRPLALELPPAESLVAPGDFATATRLREQPGRKEDATLELGVASSFRPPVAKE